MAVIVRPRQFLDPAEAGCKLLRIRKDEAGKAVSTRL